MENCPVGLLLLWIREGAVARSRVVQLMGRDSGVNMPSCVQLVAQRTATETELVGAREYLDSLDDAAIWQLLRTCRATATHWGNHTQQLQPSPEQQQPPPPVPLANCLVEGVCYLHPVSDISLELQRCLTLITLHFFSALDRHLHNGRVLFVYPGSLAQQTLPRYIEQHK